MMNFINKNEGNKLEFYNSVEWFIDLYNFLILFRNYVLLMWFEINLNYNILIFFYISYVRKKKIF